MSKKTYKILTLIALFPLIVGLACLKSKPDPTATPEPPIEEVVVPVPVETEEEVVIEEPAPTPEPATSSSEGLVLLDNGAWAQDKTRTYAFQVVENRSNNLMYEDVVFTTSFYDAFGGLVDEETQIVSKVFPGQKVGVVADFWPSDDDEEVDNVEVTWTFKRTSSASLSDDPFSVERAKFWEDDSFPMVTGEIYNSDPVAYTDIRVSFICYNHTGDIVGGGMEYLDFIHDEDYMGFASTVNIFDDVEAVDVFPYMGWDAQEVEAQDPLSKISIEDMGYGLDDFDDISGGFVIKNLTNDTFKYSYFQVTFFDEDDYVTATGTTYLNLLLPGDTIGLSPIISFQPAGAITDNFAISPFAGNIANDFNLDKNPFEVLEVSFIDEYSKDILIKLTNTYNKSISHVDIYVLAYDEDGNILGGTSDWITDPIGAGETIEHEMWLFVSMQDEIAELKGWAVPSYYSDFD